MYCMVSKKKKKSFQSFALKFTDYLVSTPNLQYTNYDSFSIITADSGPHTQHQTEPATPQAVRKTPARWGGGGGVPLCEHS